jgi:hypothetical protein
MEKLLSTVKKEGGLLLLRTLLISYKKDVN